MSPFVPTKDHFMKRLGPKSSEYMGLYITIFPPYFESLTHVLTACYESLGFPRL
jgi:hypothetical protein